MNISAIVAYTQAGRVGSSLIFCAEEAIKMFDRSHDQHTHKRVTPAAIIDIDLKRHQNEI